MKFLKSIGKIYTVASITTFLFLWWLFESSVIDAALGGLVYGALSCMLGVSIGALVFRAAKRLLPAKFPVGHVSVPVSVFLSLILSFVILGLFYGGSNDTGPLVVLQVYTLLLPVVISAIFGTGLGQKAT